MAVHYKSHRIPTTFQVQQVHRGCSFDLLAPDDKKNDEFPAEVARSNNLKGSCQSQDSGTMRRRVQAICLGLGRWQWQGSPTHMMTDITMLREKLTAWSFRYVQAVAAAPCQLPGKYPVKNELLKTKASQYV